MLQKLAQVLRLKQPLERLSDWIKVIQVGNCTGNTGLASVSVLSPLALFLITIIIL